MDIKEFTRRATGTRSFAVCIKDRGNESVHRFVTLDVASEVYNTAAGHYNLVVLNEYRDGEFSHTINATPGIMKGEDVDKPGTEFNHTGFCLSTFNTKQCCDCPNIKDCLVMYGKDVAKAAVQRVLDRMALEGRAVKHGQP